MSARGGLVATPDPVVEVQPTPAQRAMDERDWSFGGAWPYAPAWHRSDGVRLHYVDEGPRESSPVVMVHGNPTWSFLFRKLIDRLSGAGARSIAPDLLGFGRSDKPHRLREHSLARHCRLFDSLMERLALRDVTLVAHDWGGPVAMSWATRHPERLRGLVLLNTFIRPPRSTTGVASRVLIKGAHRSAHRAVWSDAASDDLSSEEKRAYAAPHPSWDSRTGILALDRALVGRRAAATQPLVDATVDSLGVLGDRPSAIVWGMDDASLAPSMLDQLCGLLPWASVRELDGVGHLVPESAAEQVCAAILELRARRHTP